MSAPDRPRWQALAGNAAALAPFAAGAWLALDWQRSAPEWHDPGPQRLIAAVLLLLAFALFCLRQLRRRSPIAVAAGDTGSASDDAVLVAYASQTGTAEALALRTARALQQAGRAVHLVGLDQLDPARLQQARCALFVVSTYGEGDPPDMAAGFARRALARSLALPALRYGVLALGDSEYDQFCGFGRRLDGWLRHQGAQALFDRIDVDNGDAGALRHWQHQVGVLAGRTDQPDWSPPRYGRWRLQARRELNPGSLGGACFLLSLQPEAGEALDWSAGDVAEIGPCQPPEAVAALLQRLGEDGTRLLDGGETLSERLARHQWPAALPAADALEAWLDTLQPLPHREYSIASIPQDGRLDLLVRQWRQADGSYGLGSGWLTRHAPAGTTIALRLRRNSHFHAPRGACPLILIGNGTGIAGLRALLRARAAQGRQRNWLLFGERQRDCDFFFADEIQDWQRAGLLERVDLAFSRDQPERVYVQQRVHAAAAALRDWVADGACIYVCGSLQGMAPAVDAELRAALGAEMLEQLAEQGRYRRDVY